MPYRITPPPMVGQIFFKDNADGEGWSETWWINDIDYNTGMTKLRQLASVMRNLLTSEIQILYLRISDSTIKGDVNIADAGLGTGSGLFNPGTGEPQGAVPSQSTFKIRLKGSINFGAGARPIFATHGFHAVPKSAIAPGYDRAVDPTGAWWTFAAQQFAVLVSAGWLCGVAKKPVITSPQYLIWNVSDFSFQKFLGSRKTGRPFGLPAGRHVAR